MKFGMRKPNINKSISAKTTSKIKKEYEKNLLYQDMERKE